MAVPSPRASARGYPIAPIDWANANPRRLEEWVRKVVDVLNCVMDGHINSLGDLTLTANTTTTTITDRRIGPNSYIDWMPTTSNAAAALATTYVSARTEGSATVTHANNSQTDRTFRYVVLG